jgi:hypothetical protein
LNSNQEVAYRSILILRKFDQILRAWIVVHAKLARNGF